MSTKQAKPAKIATAPTPLGRADRIKRALRTAAQVALSIVVGIVVGIITLASFAPDILSALVDVLPPDVYAWLGGGVAFVVSLAGALARIMAIPAIDGWLTRIGLGSEPKHQA